MVQSARIRLLVLLSTIFVLLGCEQKTQSVVEWPHAAVGVLDAVVSRDGKFSLVSSVNFGAGYWDLEKNQLLFQWRHQQNSESAITAVNLSPDGTRAITADENTFIIWNTTSGKAYGYWQAPADIRAVAISNKGRYVLLGLGSGLAVFIDMNTGRRIEFTAHRKEAVASVDLSANGAWAFTGGNDYRAILWSTVSGKPQQLFEHKTRVTKVKLGRNGKQAFTSGTLGNAHIWNIATGEKVSELQLKKREYVISAAEFSSDGKWLATGAPGRDINLWEVATGKRLKRFKARTRKQGKPSGAIIYGIGFDQSENFLISESSAGFGEKWSLSPVASE